MGYRSLRAAKLYWPTGKAVSGLGGKEPLCIGMRAFRRFIRSKSMLGTEVEVRLPAATTCATTRRRFWLVRKVAAKA
jgi:hypothetical protein